jgi:hypothetical protein
MLYICTNNNTYEWHICCAKPDVQDRVNTIQADGDELEFIREKFMSIPIPSGRVVEWTDAVAEFIFRYLDSDAVPSSSSPTREERIIEYGYDNYALEEGHFDGPDY